MTEAVAERKPLVVSGEVEELLGKVQQLSEADQSALVVKVVERLTVLGLSDLVSMIEDTFGVSAAAPVAIGAVAAAPAAEEEVEEKTSWDVVIASPGDKKIQVIKVVRSLTDLGLREAKALVDSAPAALKEGISKDEAEKIKEQLEAAGAVVELK